MTSAGGTGQMPHLEAGEKLPVVHLGKGLLLLGHDGAAQVDGQLPNVNKGMLVGRGQVQAVDLNHCQRQGIRRVTNKPMGKNT